MTPRGSRVRLLLDENVPKPLHQVLTTFILNHEIVHLLDLDGWSGTRDETLYPRAAADGFDAILTNDGRQMQRPRTVAAGMPGALALLEESDGQRLISLRGIDPTAASRLRLIDPPRRRRSSGPRFCRHGRAHHANALCLVQVIPRLAPVLQCAARLCRRDRPSFTSPAVCSPTPTRTAARDP
ncbi:hypothetical protein [Nonomuraea sp. NPDC003709]|uniref:PIN-like domain-containing protein n=1 Tax=Nonomuraea sp. NPDC003709 TaxID=3154450 RepID=UPI0033B3E3CB